MQDKVAGWEEEEVPQQHDRVPSAPEPEPTNYWQRRRGTVATAILIFGLIAAAVVPVMLCVRAWHEAESIRGVGAGRGEFRVSSCAEVRKDSDGNKTYTCTGVFVPRTLLASTPTIPGRTAVVMVFAAPPSTMTVGTDYPAGAKVPARMVGGGEVYPPSADYAAVMMAVWFTVACGVFVVEAAAVRMLERRISGKPQRRPGGRRLGWLLVPVAVAAGVWLLAFVLLLICFDYW